MIVPNAPVTGVILSPTVYVPSATGVIPEFASTVATSACFWLSYQPEEPKCLRDE